MTFASLKGEDLDRYNTLLTFLGPSYKVRSTRIGNGSLRYSIEIEEVGTSTVYKIDGRTIEQVCDSVVTHIIQDRSGRKETADADAIRMAGAFRSSAMISEKVMKEFEEFFRKSMPYAKTRRK